MRVVTWNVNSLRARLERVEEWVAEVQPDVLLPAGDQARRRRLPGADVRGAGLRVVRTTARASGTAWPSSSKVGIDDVVDQLRRRHRARPRRPHRHGDVRRRARHQRATCPTADRSTTTTTRTSCRWLDRLVDHLDADTSTRRRRDRRRRLQHRSRRPRRPRPGEARRGHPRQRARARPARRHSSDWGLVDVFRQQHPTPTQVYSWWDYRGGDFHQGRGMRIDLLLRSASVAERRSGASSTATPARASSPATTPRSSSTSPDVGADCRRARRRCRRTAVRLVSAPSPVMASSSSGVLGRRSAIAARSRSVHSCVGQDVARRAALARQSRSRRSRASRASAGTVANSGGGASGRRLGGRKSSRNGLSLRRVAAAALGPVHGSRSVARVSAT